MGLPRNMRRVLTWLATEKGITLLLVLGVGIIVGVTWLYVNRSADRQADATASRLAAAVVQDVTRNVGQLDLIPTALKIDTRPPARADRADAVGVGDQEVPSAFAGLDNGFV